jgi:uncharacterized protein (DUF427 family)
MMPVPVADPVKPGQESVWDYPRPAIMRPSARHLRIEHKGLVLAETRRGLETLEISHPPSYYFPVEDILATALRPLGQRSLCEWKGQARYFDVGIGGARMASTAWCYDRPTPAFAGLVGHVAFYAAPFDLCTVDGERVVPQPGGFYGSWITSHVAGPFKGVPGSQFW